jgi:hypothetical protein
MGINPILGGVAMDGHFIDHRVRQIVSIPGVPLLVGERRLAVDIGYADACTTFVRDCEVHNRIDCRAVGGVSRPSPYGPFPPDLCP